MTRVSDQAVLRHEVTSANTVPDLASSRLGDIFETGLPRTGKHSACLPICLFEVPDVQCLNMHRFPEACLMSRMILYPKNLHGCDEATASPTKPHCVLAKL